MFCPNCGQENISQDTRFCSRCGFLLTATYDLLQTGGVDPNAHGKPQKWQSPRSRGLKQGLFIFLLTFLVVPIVTMLTIAANTEPIAVVISAVLLCVGGLLRMAYALLFEEPAPSKQASSDDFLSAAQSHLNRAASAGVLPPQQSIPTSAYAAPKTGTWRDTNDLQPSSVVEGTTKLLDKDEQY